MSLQELVHQYY